MSAPKIGWIWITGSQVPVITQPVADQLKEEDRVAAGPIPLAKSINRVINQGLTEWHVKTPDGKLRRVVAVSEYGFEGERMILDMFPTRKQLEAADARRKLQLNQGPPSTGTGTA